jgi:hypothetical protein
MGLCAAKLDMGEVGRLTDADDDIAASRARSTSALAERQAGDQRQTQDGTRSH